MRRWAAAAIIAVLWAGLMPSAGAHTITAPSIFGTRDAKGIPRSMDGVPVLSSGTGFYVSSAGDFVTAYHVAAACTARAILRPEGPVEAEVVALNEKADVAVLRSLPPPNAAELVSAMTFTLGTPFEIVRYVHLGGLASRSSILAWYLGGADLPDRPQVSFAVRAEAAIVGGNSGGPLVAMSGGVAGFLDAAELPGRTIAFAVSAHTIGEVLAAAGVAFRWKKHGEIADSLKHGGALLYTYPVVCYREGP